MQIYSILTLRNNMRTVLNYILKVGIYLNIWWLTSYKIQSKFKKSFGCISNCTIFVTAHLRKTVSLLEDLEQGLQISGFACWPSGHHMLLYIFFFQKQLLSWTDHIITVWHGKHKRYASYIKLISKTVNKVNLQDCLHASVSHTKWNKFVLRELP